MSIRPANVRIGLVFFSLDVLLMLRGLVSILLLIFGRGANPGKRLTTHPHTD